jgi:hypothetical protein
VSAIGYFKTLRPVTKPVRESENRRSPRREREWPTLPVGAGSPADCFPFSADPKSVEHALRLAHNRLDLSMDPDEPVHGRIVVYGRLPPGAVSHYQSVPCWEGW